ncbi:MAG: hypothetical protein IPJ88_15830 [Myxococcales bacterium]|nr:MAG: hypothetical protein IPJ88_15830 [Myxococcales bacterium]
MQDFDIAGLRAILATGVEPFAGRADLHLSLRGHLSSPELLIEGALREGNFLSLEPVTAVYVLNYSDGVLEFDAQAEIEERAVLSINGSSHLQLDVEHPIEAIRQGQHHFLASIDNLSLDVISRATKKPLENLSASVFGDLEFNGFFHEFSLDGTLRLSEFVFRDSSPVDIQTRFNFGGQTLLLSLSTLHEQRKLFDAEGAFQLPPNTIPEASSAFAAKVLDQPWQLSFAFPPRRLDRLPSPLSEYLNFPAVIQGKANFSGGQQTTTGSVDLSTTWFGSSKAGGLSKSRPRMRIRGDTNNDQTHLSFDGFVGTDRTFKAEASAKTPLHQWIRAELPFSIPGTRFSGHLWRMPMEDIPLMPNYIKGPADIAWNAKALFTEKPSWTIELRSSALRFFETSPIVLTLEAKTTPEGVSVEATTEDLFKGKGTVTGHLPLKWLAQPPFASFDSDAPFSLHAKFKKARLQPILTSIPSVTNADAIATGQVDLAGSINDIRITGSMDVSNGYLQLVGLGQQLQNIQGQIIFREKWAELKNIRATDGQGSSRILGGIGFEGLRPTKIKLSLNSSRFPVRREGAVLARLTGSANMTATTTPERLDAAMVVHNLSVALPDENNSGVQELSPHPDLTVDGGKTATEEGDSTPFIVHMQSMRRNPFGCDVRIFPRRSLQNLM